MPANYPPVSTDHTTITVPVDGDRRNAASVATGLEQLADNIAFTQGNWLPLGGGTMQGTILLAPSSGDPSQVDDENDNDIPGLFSFVQAANGHKKLIGQWALGPQIGGHVVYGRLYTSGDGASNSYFEWTDNASWNDGAGTWGYDDSTHAASRTLKGNLGTKEQFFSGATGWADSAWVTRSQTESGTNAFGLSLSGAGSGFGALITAGPTGAGAVINGGATSGSGAIIASNGGNSYGVEAYGSGNHPGIFAEGGASGSGGQFEAGGGNAPGLTSNGNGSGAGLTSAGGATGVGGSFLGGGSSGSGIQATAQGGNSPGGAFTGNGSGQGLQAIGGATGDGILGTAGGGNAHGVTGVGSGTGAGLHATPTGAGPGVAVDASGGSGFGISVVGNGSNAAISASAAGGSAAIRGAATGSGAACSLTGTTSSNGVLQVDASAGSCGAVEIIANTSRAHLYLVPVSAATLAGLTGIAGELVTYTDGGGVTHLAICTNTGSPFVPLT